MQHLAIGEAARAKARGSLMAAGYRIILATLGLGILACGTAAGSDVRSPGKWLVDLGRDYPLTPQAGLSTVDAQIAVLFMQAAARVEPGLAEAYRWQIDLLRVLGREDEVRPVLEAYLRVAPDDVPARLAWLRAMLDGLQTSDARAAFCRERLTDQNLPQAVSSELHRQLADFHWNRGDEAEARREAEAALRDDLYNIGVRQFLMDIAPPAERWVYHVGILLGHLEESPGDLGAARSLGDELSLRGLPAEAEIWYRHAQQLAELLAPGKPQTGLLLARAAVLMEMKRLDEAEELAKQAVQAEPMTVDTLIVRAQVALLKGDMKAAEGHFRQASKLCKDTVDNVRGTQGSLDRSLLADIAWFFAHYDPQEEYAEGLSQSILVTDTDNAVARRAYGALQLRHKQYADAEITLAPVADRDVWSAMELADALKGAGQKDQAVAQLRALTTRPANFEQRHLIRGRYREWNVDFPATQPAALAVQKMVASFKPEKRDYPFHPGKYLSAGLSVPRTSVLPGEPWWCGVRLVNTGTFAIAIGNGMMIEPGLLTLVETKGDRRRSSEGSLRILLDRRLRLMPGETLEFSQTLDIGPIRAGMIGTPQVTHDVQVTGIVNPLPATDAEGHQTWQVGIGGLKLAPTGFSRTQLRVDAELMRRLPAQTRSGATEDRILAMEQLAMLLGEYQHLASGRVHYMARPIDPDVVRVAVLAMADDPNWYIRARLAECMRWFMLDATTMPTAMKLLNDSHWLVRSLARRLLADQHGGKFAKVLESTSEGDSDGWAKEFARALLGRQRASESRPAPTQPSQMGGP